ncbi:N-6 DNA methylase [Arenibacter sp. F26102]|uniref:class I SAM-dependent DNA methyltransferase n=1 Tax=Arenibacter sp. F26102 TaxID=2926416 RepID=UPI001FF1F84B|nr:DNA methyltransferase [Arenibacter sp. F26102]MCK0148324.1 N-6 DNA methylase [Arenibacter sp. F26102]
MNISQIESNLAKLIKNFDKESFIYNLLLAYNLPKATVTRLQKGSANLSKVEGEVSLKKKLFFKEVYNEDLHLSITNIAKDIKHDQRFVIATDYKTLLAKDTKMNTTLDIPIKDLPKNYDFFLPWAGMEKAQLQEENPADIKAAVKMAKLFDEIKNDNENDSPEFLHSLNIFLSRLLFCFFAEDTDIFKDNQFTNAITSHTQEDGSDLCKYLDKLFEVLNTPESKRTGLPEYLDAFPYVNGGLFAHKHKAPNFSKSSRKVLIESGNQDWADINPDIFGSMFQAVNHADNRGTLGQHFTSVPNIMKVIEPLFLNDLKEEFENAKGNNKKLNQLLYRLKNIKIFDPACGSGNFLIIAYKELRRLEMEIFKEMGSLALSEISLSQFYGIELDDFAHEIAILALWLTKHQMNVEFFKEFGRTNPTLPLSDAGNIVQGNACRLDWEEVCPKEEKNEIYILGNPPYLGSKIQSKAQKEDLKLLNSGIPKSGNLDYIACWFLKAANFIQSSPNTSFCFVTTNSICQGTQVPMLWPYILNKGLEIGFAYPDFVWSNNAKNKAKVICSIIGVRNISSKKKMIFNEHAITNVQNINPYLKNTKTIVVNNSNSPISNLPKMRTGNIPYDGGHLILSKKEKILLIDECPSIEKYIKKLSGSREYINDIERFCIWIEEEEYHEAKKIPLLNEVFESVKKSRLKAGNVARTFANRPYRFCMNNRCNKSQIILPRVSSMRREYIPFGFLDSETIVSDSAQVIFDPELYIFGILMSKIHMLWVDIVAGRLKNDFRYSPVVCYNTFPFPPISKQRKEELTQSALNIIDERLKHSEKTLAQIYDPDKMPEGLREAHRQNDLAVERCYRSTPFSSDEERLEYLFKLYEKMIQEEKDKKIHKKK